MLLSCIAMQVSSSAVNGIKHGNNKVFLHTMTTCKPFNPRCKTLDCISLLGPLSIFSSVKLMAGSMITMLKQAESLSRGQGVDLFSFLPWRHLHQHCAFVHCTTLANPSCGGSLSQMRNKGLKWFACCRFDDLVRRFERPDGRNRWDSQLFEINPSIGWFFSSVF